MSRAVPQRSLPPCGALRGRERCGTHLRISLALKRYAGLPQHDAYLAVLREAMAVDRQDPVGVFFGTSTGQLYGSTDEGRTWNLAADNLPAIWSVEAAVVE